MPSPDVGGPTPNAEPVNLSPGKSLGAGTIFTGGTEMKFLDFLWIFSNGFG